MPFSKLLAFQAKHRGGGVGDQSSRWHWGVGMGWVEQGHCLFW